MSTQAPPAGYIYSPGSTNQAPGAASPALGSQPNIDTSKYAKPTTPPKPNVGTAPYTTTAQPGLYGAVATPMPAVPTYAGSGAAPGGTGGTGGSGGSGGTGAYVPLDSDSHPDDAKFGGSADQKAFVSQIRADSAGKNEDMDRFSAAQISAWQKYYDADASAKAGKPQFRSARGAPGLYDKPSECPQGQVPNGKGDTAPCVPMGSVSGGGGGAGNADGGGAGGTGGGTGGAGGWGLSQEEKDYLSAMGGLASTMQAQSDKLFATGLPAYQKSTDYYMKLSGAYGRGGMESALGASREDAAQTFAGQQAQLRGLRGAEKAAAQAQLTSTEAATLARQPAELQAGAAEGLQKAGQYGVSTGLTSEGQAAGIYGNMQQALSQSRLAEEGFDTNKWITSLQTKTQWNIAALQDTTNRYQIDAQKGVAMAQLAQSAYQWSFDYTQKTEELQAQIEQWRHQNVLTGQGQQTSMWGSIIGGLL